MNQREKAERFQALHKGPGAFVIPNPWDRGSARILAGLGFQALATSSGAAAGVLGRRDGKITRDEALAQVRIIVAATDLPVSPDLESVRKVCESLSRPVNFMVGIKGKSFSVAELEQAGVRRISLATSLFRAAMTSLIDAAREVKEHGTFGYLERAFPTPDINRY